MHALSLRDVARELGRTEEWTARNHAYLTQKKGMPAPLHPNGTLVWSAPQFYAWLDSELPAALRPHAAAYRAAFDAAQASGTDDDLAAARSRIKERISSGAGA